MPVFKRILLATDLSSSSACAELFAVELAKQCPGSGIDLVYVYEDIMPYAMGDQYPVSDILWSKLLLESGEHLKSKLIALAETLAKSANVSVIPIMLYGSPTYEIEKYARKNGFDCLVLATHGRRGIQRAVLGSVAERVIRHSPCPTFVVNSKEPPSRTPAFKKIILTTDLSENADAARPFAMGLAALNSGTVHLVHVFENQLYYAESESQSTTFNGAIRQEHTAREAQLNAYSRQISAGDSHVIHLLENGDPAEKINLYARSIDADCIVVATHGRTGISHFLIGSVAERILRNATCPVLCIRPQNILPGKRPAQVPCETASKA